jgi:hypothetical protein
MGPNESKRRRTIRVSERLLAGLVALTLSAPAAHAQDRDSEPPGKSDQEKRTARELYQLGNERYGLGDFVGALEAFRAAHRIMGVPTTALGVGKAHMKLGQLIDARALLLMAAKYPESSDEPPSFATARREAQTLADELRARIPKLAVEVVVQAGTARVRIDGVEMTAEEASGPRELDPGTHLVQASALGHLATAQSVELKEGESRVVQLVLAPEPPPAREPAPASEPPPTAPAPPPLPVDSGTTPAMVVAIASFSIAGAGVIVGAVTGAVSLDAAADLEDLCAADKTCPPSAADTRERSLTAAHVSTGSFIVAGVGVAAGIAALLVHTWRPAETGPRISFSAGGLAIDGDF